MKLKRLITAVVAAIGVAAASPIGEASAGRCPATDVASLAEAIAFGHAYDKHVVRERQFREGHVVDGRPFPDPTIGSRPAFADFLEAILAGSPATQKLQNRRYAYWDARTGTVVIANLRADDCGTAFRPRDGRGYYDGLR